MLLTVSEVCAQLKIGRTTFYKLVGSGDLKALKSGKKTLVAEDEVARWIASLPSYRLTVQTDSGSGGSNG
jgi:excisionase family DNA binding protein